MKATEMELLPNDPSETPVTESASGPAPPRTEMILSPAQSTPSIKEVQALQHHAALLSRSGLTTTKKSVEQIVAIGLLGHELGIPLLASLQGIHLIQGQPSFSANLTASLLARGGVTWECVQNTAEQATVLFHRKEWQDIESSFTMDEAKQAGLNGKDSWRKYPADMLWARAFTRGARKIGPDLLAGFGGYTPDELGMEGHDETFTPPNPPAARSVNSRTTTTPSVVSPQPPQQARRPNASSPATRQPDNPPSHQAGPHVAPQPVAPEHEEIPKPVTELIQHLLALNEQLKGDAKREMNIQGLVARVRELRSTGQSWKAIETQMEEGGRKLDETLQAQLAGDA